MSLGEGVTSHGGMTSQEVTSQGEGDVAGRVTSRRERNDITVGCGR